MKIALGTAQFGMQYGIENTIGQVDFTEASKILKFCKSIGINSIDTAISYGESEKCLGRVGCNSFNLISKLPECNVSPKEVPSWVRKEINQSLDRLCIKNIDGILLHRPEQLYSDVGSNILNTLIELQKEGILKKIGVSIYNPSDLDTIFKLHNFDIVQCPYNIIDRRLETSGWLERLKIKRTEIHTRSSFLQGLLLMPIEKIPPKFRSWDFLWALWNDWLKDNNITALEGAISFVLSNTQIDKVIIGVDSKNQLQQVAKAAKLLKEFNYPNISCTDSKLINPALWGSL